MERKEEPGKDRIENSRRIVLDGEGEFPKDVVIAMKNEERTYRLEKTRKGGFLLIR
ncbi:MAG: hypothetical protein ACYDIC_07275 [Desulfobaccales bacterium]